MTASTPVGFGPTDRRRHQRTSGHTGRGIGESGGDTVDRGGHSLAPLTDRIGERDEIILVGVGRQRAGVTHEFPPTRGGDASGMHDAQVPGMWLGDGGQRPDDRCRVRIDEGQRRHGVVRAPWPAAATGNVHAPKIIVWVRRGGPDTRATAREISNRYRLMINRYHLSRGAAQPSPITPRAGNARSVVAADRSRLA